MRAFETTVGHFRNFDKGEVETYLSDFGFRLINAYYAGFPFYSPFYRDLCNIQNKVDNSFSKGKYGMSHKIICSVLYYLFWTFSTRKKYGDQFVGLFVGEN